MTDATVDPVNEGTATGTRSQDPRTFGPYSTIRKMGELISVSGQYGVDPETGELIGPGVEEQTRQALDNVVRALAQCGARLEDALCVRIHLANMELVHQVNDVYSTKVPEPYPTRTTVQVGLRMEGALIEIDALAVAGESA